MSQSKQLLYILSVSVSFLMLNCKKIIQTDSPSTQLGVDKVFSDENSAVAVLYNIYAQWNALNGNITSNMGLYADELTTTSVNAIDLEFYNNAVTTVNGTNLNIWKGCYSTIYQSNLFLEGLHNAGSIPDPVKSRLEGEALFLRTFSYYFLVTFYGDVPLLMTTDVAVTGIASRTARSAVVQQMIADLALAKSKLTADYPTGAPVRVNKWAASALLARIYLIEGNWELAKQEASAVIDSGVYVLSSLGDVYHQNSPEAILQFSTPFGYTALGASFVPPPGNKPKYTISPWLLTSFEAHDLRRIQWVDSTESGGVVYQYPVKYKNRNITEGSNAEYVLALGLAEQFLIRAEARMKLNDFEGARQDLNRIRERAGLSPVADSSEQPLESLIQKERICELFLESGLRFSDLKRWGDLDAVLGIEKPNWTSKAVVLPLPQNEINTDPNLIQNPGY